MPNLSQINHSQAVRENIAQHLVEHPHEIQEYLDIINSKAEKEYFKAAWALEFVARIDIRVLLPYLDKILELAKNETADQAIRPFAKIIETIVLLNYSDSEDANFLSTSQKELMAEQCFDWLITKQKVAAKAYGMTSLYELGKDFDWIHPELKTHIEAHFAESSAAFKARGRHILKRL